MYDFYGALQVLILLVVPWAIGASLLVIIGLALDVPGYVRKIRESFHRANETVSKSNDWETFYRD